MPDATPALTLLALFTTADKAAEIEGDLLEQAQSRGRLWFWLQVKLTCIALFFHQLRTEPANLLLGYAAYELVLKLNWWALSPLRFALWRGLDLDRSQLPMLDNSIIFVVALGLGKLVTWLSPKRGGQITLLAAGFVLGRVALLDGIEALPRLLVFALLPGVAGMLMMKWMQLRRGGPQDLWASL
jgi:hypothetical protein